MKLISLTTIELLKVLALLDGLTIFTAAQSNLSTLHSSMTLSSSSWIFLGVPGIECMFIGTDSISLSEGCFDSRSNLKLNK